MAGVRGGDRAFDVCLTRLFGAEGVEDPEGRGRRACCVPVDGAGLCFGYALLGASWLVGKTDGVLRKHAYEVLPFLTIGVGVFLVVVFGGDLLGLFARLAEADADTRKAPEACSSAYT